MEISFKDCQLVNVGGFDKDEKNTDLRSTRVGCGWARIMTIVNEIILLSSGRPHTFETVGFGTEFGKPT